MKDDFLISISTENGTGSQTANKILSQSISLAGYHVSSKNLFPSNIAGLPTHYKIRVSSKGYNSFPNSKNPDLCVLFNKKNIESDLTTADKNSILIINEDFKYEGSPDNNFYELPCRTLTKALHSSVSTRKLLYNMLYVGAILKALGIDLSFGEVATKKVLFHLKEDLKGANLKALEAGYENCFKDSLFELKPLEKEPKPLSLDGNTAMALGFLDGGAQVFTWYPITPSSSVAEGFESMAKEFNLQRSVLQCEDELSAVTASLGAGWAGARALTATSGPGLSLMQESLGLGYFTETPFVVADIQRAGPSTGLPTRTAQGDLIMAYYSSHGDTIHPVLIPSTPNEAYSDSFNSLSLAQDLQSPVFVLSDLDLGMNEWASDEIVQDERKLSNGKLQKDTVSSYKRYSNDELTASRSLPGLSDSSMAYFTRGSGHDEYGRYSESPDIYEAKLKRLKNKIYNGRSISQFFPQDVVKDKTSKVSLIYYGTTSQIIPELLDLLGEYQISTYQVRALPIHNQLKDFINNHETNFVLEQNRDGQLFRIIKSEVETKNKIKFCTQCNGLPADPQIFFNQVMENLKDEH